ncbi:MAG: InlB B-repeat-containing protein [Oscillospiraceae bacterium]|nr:InlB B-repeat-containing protein [Oscillospiraceae bacterium]
MKKNVFKKAFLLFVAVFLMLTMSSVAVTAAKNEVKLSEVFYNVNINHPFAYIANLNPISGKIGDEMYMIYTVAEVDEIVAHQHALVGTDDTSRTFPYMDGGLMQYKSQDTTTMMKPGYTYFIKFVVTKGGFEYKIAMAKGDESSYVVVPHMYGDGTAKMKHFGVWIDGGSSKVKLTNVHFYDKNGKDLGVASTTGVSAMRSYTQPIPKAKDVNHTYSVSVNKQYNVMIGNKFKNETDKMTIEYTVKSSSAKNYQSGLRLNMLDISGGGSTQFPHMNVTYDPEHVESTEMSEMLVPGAQYLVEMYSTGTERGWDYIVQRTYKGKTEWFKFTIANYGIPSAKNFGFSALFFGEGPYHYSTFALTDVRIYDANHKNLGVQSNIAADIVHHGEMISYEKCDSLYYNEEKDTFIAIYPDKTIEVTKDGITKQGKYTVRDEKVGRLTATFGSKKENYEFFLAYLVDSEGNRYDALGRYKASFVTGTDDKIETQILSNENGYKVVKPKDPNMSGDEFVAWVTGDGQEFDFNKVVTSSVTLYAKWKNGAGNTYISVEGEKVSVNFNPYIAIGLSILSAAIAAVACIMIVKKSKKKNVQNL